MYQNAKGQDATLLNAQMQPSISIQQPNVASSGYIPMDIEPKVLQAIRPLIQKDKQQMIQKYGAQGYDLYEYNFDTQSYNLRQPTQSIRGGVPQQS
jgi:hypothetical protein